MLESQSPYLSRSDKEPLVEVWADNDIRRTLRNIRRRPGGGSEGKQIIRSCGTGSYIVAARGVSDVIAPKPPPPC